MSFIIRGLFQGAKVCQSVTVNQQRAFKNWVYPTLRELKKRQEQAPPPAIKRTALLEWNYDAEIYAFSNRLGEKFDLNTLRKAFINEGYVEKLKKEQKGMGIEEPVTVSHNEGLAKEGEKITSDYIYGYLRKHLFKLPEEGIQAIHKFLMSDEVLAHVCEMLGAKYLILCGEEPEPSPAVYKTTFYAVVGALSKSSGADRASLFVRDFVLTQLAERDVSDVWCPESPWEVLEQINKNEGKSPPEARLAFEAGRGTLLEAYCVAVFVDQVMIGKGFGENLRFAKEMAAVDCLRRMFEITDDRSPFLFDASSGSALSDFKNLVNSTNVSLENWSESKVKNVVYEEK